ncbi:hypothetical protein ACFL35_11180 [Candidatus Riflebacteria bacterium]
MNEKIFNSLPNFECTGTPGDLRVIIENIASSQKYFKLKQLFWLAVGFFVQTPFAIYLAYLFNEYSWDHKTISNPVLLKSVLGFGSIALFFSLLFTYSRYKEVDLKILIDSKLDKIFELLSYFEQKLSHEKPVNLYYFGSRIQENYNLLNTKNDVRGWTEVNSYKRSWLILTGEFPADVQFKFEFSEALEEYILRERQGGRTEYLVQDFIRVTLNCVSEMEQLLDSTGNSLQGFQNLPRETSDIKFIVKQDREASTRLNIILEGPIFKTTFEWTGKNLENKDELPITPCIIELLQTLTSNLADNNPPES